MEETMYPYRGVMPEAEESAFIAPGAKIIGDVKIGKNAGIWYNCVLRGDVNSIVIGENSNIQDNATIHCDSGRSGLKADGIPTVVGRNVTVGHNCLLHACTIEDDCLIGMSATILDGAVIGRGSVVGAGTLITKGKIIPPFSVVMGVPGKIVKTLEESSVSERRDQANHYARLAREHKEALGLK